jgi:signal transduction histidine kinase/ActR/RegA family two-component response regulator
MTNLQYTPYTIILFLGMALAVFLGITAWRHRSVPVAKSMTAMMAVLTIWMLGYALQLASVDLEGKIFWNQIKYIGVAPAATMWLLCAIQFTGRGRWITPRTLAILAVEPILIIILVWTNHHHNLIYESIRLNASGPFVVRIASHGSFFWVHVVYSYIIIMIGAVFLIQELLRTKNLFRGQSLAILIATASPWIGNILYVSGINPFPYLDLTPIFFMITGFALLWATSRFGFLDIVPIARDFVMENMNQGVIVLDMRGRIVDINLAACRFLEIGLPEAFGVFFPDIIPIEGDSMEIFRGEKEHSSELFLGETGNPRYYDLNISAVRNPNQMAVGNIVVLTDITERKLNEEILQSAQIDLENRVKERTHDLTLANTQLKQEIRERRQAERERNKLEVRLLRAQKMEAIGTLASGVAHDLNNILSGLISYPQMLIRKYRENEPLKKSLTKIQNTGVRAAAIVDDMLALSRRGAIISEIVNWNDIVSDYLESPEFEHLKHSFPNVRIEADLDPQLLNMSGSTVQLVKTLMNLVTNALEAMPNGGSIMISTRNQHMDKPYIGYELIEAGDYVVLTISDTGVGLAQEDVKRIFEPFYTKKEMGRKGTGLGMTVVWGTVKDHNGRIDIDSGKDIGTTITLYFQTTTERITEREALASMESYLGRGESILIVDDIEDQREIASTILENLGYTVNHVASGEEAVEYMTHHTVDLLLLDMIMDPGIDGLETYRRVLGLHPGQKAVIASGYAENERVKEAKRLGVGAYIKKPYLMETIGKIVRMELDRGGAHESTSDAGE